MSLRAAGSLIVFLTSFAAPILPLRMRSNACLTAVWSAELVVVETGAATGANDSAGWESALASVSVPCCGVGAAPSPGRGRGSGGSARETVRLCAAAFLPAGALAEVFAAGAVFLAAVATGFAAGFFAAAVAGFLADALLSFAPASFLA